MNVNSIASTNTFKYLGNEGTIYLYSKSGGVRVYGISVSSTGGSSEGIYFQPTVTRDYRTGYDTLTVSSNLDQVVEIGVQPYTNIAIGEVVTSGYAVSWDVDMPIGKNVSSSALSVSMPNGKTGNTIDDQFNRWF